MRGRVVNIKSGEPFDVYIGRANPRFGLSRSIWANPYRGNASKEVRDGTRQEVIEKFEQDLRNGGPRTPPGLVDRVPELKGKTLACWCSPEPCHGDVLLQLAEEASTT